MHDNRNKEVIKRVEKGMMKANRTRNTFCDCRCCPYNVYDYNGFQFRY